MSITSRVSSNGEDMTIAIEGSFDFRTHMAFREVCQQAARLRPLRYVVDFRDTTYLDSSALGMLLLLRDQAGGDAANITLANANADVRKLLQISGFERLFEIP